MVIECNNVKIKPNDFDKFTFPESVHKSPIYKFIEAQYNRNIEIEVNNLVIRY